MSSRESVRPLRRFREGGAGDVLDASLAELFRAVQAPPGLSAAELAEVGARLRSSGRSRRFSFGRHAVLLAVGMFAGSGFALASYGVKRWVAAPASAPAASEPARPNGESTPRGQVRPGERRPDPAPLPSAEIASVANPGRKIESAAPAPAAPAASGPLAREAELLARALAKLRSEANPIAALAVLDEYQREFPRGTLSLESQVARLDAFLALGRQSDALELLDTLPIDRIGRGAELRVVRAELRAREEPARALEDFNLALAVPLSGPLEERALFGRAQSRLRAGDRAGAEADLRRYLERHPHGRFEKEAESKLHAGSE